MLDGNAYAVRDRTGRIIAYQWTGGVAEAISTLERELTTLMAGDLAVVEFAGTTLLRDVPLRRSGYLDTLPCIPLVAVPHNRTHDTAAGDRELLSTAACFHVLAALASRVGDDPLSCYTCGSVCHRAEATEAEAPLRLSSFRMRELVLIGEPEGVMAHGERAFSRLSGHLSAALRMTREQEATDVFYGTNAQLMRRLQSAKKVKREIVTEWSEEDEYAVASWNLHGSRLVSAFGGPADGVQSTCVAFGVERLALALLAAEVDMLPGDFLANIRIG